jgi:hypothetical protein
MGKDEFVIFMMIHFYEVCVWGALVWKVHFNTTGIIGCLSECDFVAS